MNLSKQIRYFRKRDGMSQEKLAEKIYVSRQSISNWENERSYPDIHNLLMMSVLFHVSLDDLVKGDVNMMKEALQQSSLWKWTYIMIAFVILTPLSVAPSIYFLGNMGLFIPLAFFVLCMVAALRVEKIKKQHQLKTFRQIVEFVEGRPVHEGKPTLKDKMIKMMLVLASVLISFGLVYLGLSILNV